MLVSTIPDAPKALMVSSVSSVFDCISTREPSANWIVALLSSPVRMRSPASSSAPASSVSVVGSSPRSRSTVPRSWASNAGWGWRLSQAMGMRMRVPGTI